MKQGKGFYLVGQVCAECGQAIPHGATGQPAYWAYEPQDYRDYRGWNSGRIYYHRSCARKVTQRRVAERERNMADLRAIQRGATR